MATELAKAKILLCTHHSLRQLIALAISPTSAQHDFPVSSQVCRHRVPRAMIVYSMMKND